MFAASYDRTTRIVSAAACAVLLLVALAVFVTFLAYAWSPRRYAVSEGAIVVRRLVGSVRIPLSGIREARRAIPDDLRGCIRLWGSGGMFGYYGLFRTSHLGNCTWYVTDRRNIVVVRTDAKTALFSPDDVEGFLTAIGAPAPAAAPPPAEPRGRFSPALLIGGAIAVLALPLALFAVFYSPGPPRCTLTPQALTIHDRFYPVTLAPSQVDITGVRLVNVATDPEWRPVARTNGFANAHYRSGWFRVASGRKVRLYRADGVRLVLLPPAGDVAPVLVEVAEPERFVQELRRVWGARR